MPYQANVFKIMLSYSSDSEEECLTLKNCINRWNDVYSKNYGVVLLAVDHKNNVFFHHK